MCTKKKKKKEKEKIISHIEKTKRRVRVYERNFQNSRNFFKNSQFGYCGSSDNPCAFIEKGKQS